MVSAENVFSYPDWTIPFTIYTDSTYKQLVDVIIQNNKPITYFSRRLIKSQR